MHIYTPNGSTFIIAESPEQANQVLSDYFGLPEPITGLTWTEVPDVQNIEAWQLRTQSASDWIAQVGTPSGVILVP